MGGKNSKNKKNGSPPNNSNPNNGEPQIGGSSALSPISQAAVGAVRVTLQDNAPPVPKTGGMSAFDMQSSSTASGSSGTSGSGSGSGGSGKGRRSNKSSDIGLNWIYSDSKSRSSKKSGNDERSAFEKSLSRQSSKSGSLKQYDKIRLGLLGKAGAGKTTLFKQFKIVFSDGDLLKPSVGGKRTRKELIGEIRQQICNNLLDGMERIGKSLAIMGIELEREINSKLLRTKIMIASNEDENSNDEHNSSSSNATTFSSWSRKRKPTLKLIDKKFASALKILWADRGIKEALDRLVEVKRLNPGVVHLDTLSYFMSRLDEVISDNYEPTEKDLLLLSKPTESIETFTFPSRGELFTVVDVGGSTNARAKSWNQLDDLTAILFVIPISEFDMADPTSAFKKPTTTTPPTPTTTTTTTTNSPSTTRAMPPPSASGSPPANITRRPLGSIGSFGSTISNTSVSATDPAYNSISISLQLFSQVCQTEEYNDTLIFICLNKIDSFKERLDTDSTAFTEHFEGFHGQGSAEGAEYVGNLFLEEAAKHNRKTALYFLTGSDPDLVITDLMDILEQVSQKVDLDRALGNRSFQRKWSSGQQLILPDSSVTTAAAKAPPKR